MNELVTACVMPIATHIAGGRRERKLSRHVRSIRALQEILAGTDPSQTSHVKIVNNRLAREHEALASLDDQIVRRSRSAKMAAWALGLLVVTVVGVGVVLPAFLPSADARERALYGAAIASLLAAPVAVAAWALREGRYSNWFIRGAGWVVVASVSLELVLVAAALVSGTSYHQSLR